MKKSIVFCLFISLILIAPLGYGQGLSSADIYKSFKYRLHPDPIIFSDSVIYQLINLASEIACDHGLAYPEIDTITLATGTDEYGLIHTALWVYRVGKIAEGERSWQRVGLSQFGKEGMSESVRPAFYDFVTVLENLTSTFDAGNDTSYIYIYPKPIAADDGDTILVHYFAFADTIDDNLRSDYQNAVVELALMLGNLRKGRSDKAVVNWNNASLQLSVLRNSWLAKIFNLEVVPKTIGGD